jgi:transmembrane sensor
MADTRQLPVIEQAAAWVVNMSAHEVSAEQRTAFESWLAEDPRHRTLYEQAQCLWQPLTIANQEACEVSGGKVACPGRSIASLLSILLTVCATYALPWDEWLADERATVGEIREIRLVDGSQLVLDSGSAVDIAFNERERRLILRSGRLMINVAPDGRVARRPFLVESRDGVSRAQGARYVVGQSDGESLVGAIESRVLVTSHGRPDHSVSLEAGQSVRLGSRHMGKVEALPPAATSWMQARLVYEDTPLEQVIADLGRYRKGHLRLDTEAAGLRFTGVLPADDPDAALELLEHALPVYARHYTGWLARIALRQHRK